MAADDFSLGFAKPDLWSDVIGGGVRTAFEGNQQSLFFSGNGVRVAQTNPLDTTLFKSYEFDLIYGDGVNGWERNNYPISLEYSVDDGGTWRGLQTFTLPGQWTRFKGNFPVSSQSPNTLLRWDQNNTFRAGSQVWAIDNIVLKTEPFEAPTLVDFGNVLREGFWSDISSGRTSGLFGTGPALLFTGAGQRFAQTTPINTLINKSLEFDLIYGDGVNGGRENQYPISLEASIDDGRSWQELAEFSRPSQWTRFKVNVPPSAQSEQTLLRWDQNNTFSEGSHQWAIDNIALKQQAIVPLSTVNFSNGLRDGLWSNISNGKVNSTFAGRTQSLFFGGNGARFVQTVPLNTQRIKALEFDLIYGDGTNGGSVNRYPISLEYSTDKGLSWQSLQTYANPSQWTKFKVNLPQGAQAPEVLLRWDQNNTFSAGTHVWGLDNLSFKTAPYQAPTVVDFTNNLDDGFWRDINNGRVNDLFRGRSKSLRFAGDGARFVETVPLNISVLTTLEFDLIYGNDLNGGGINRYPIALEYSVDNGDSWFSIKTFSNSGTWAKQNVSLPAVAQSPATLLRWNQNNTFRTGTHVWAIDNIRLLPKPTLLNLIAGSAAQTEGNFGSKVFAFTVRRSGDLTKESSVSWLVAGTGSTPANAGDFLGGAFPRGSLSFDAGESIKTLTISVNGDTTVENNETFRITLSAPSLGTTLGSASATGKILNDDLIGDGNRNTLVGTARAEFLDGRANVDTLTGGGAADVFGFRFGESPLAAPDRITDFAFGTDKIDLFTASGGALPAPVRFSRAANNTSAKSLGALAAAVFADANGALTGNQGLGANGAALVQATNAAIAGTYLVVNNAVAGRSTNDDLMIKLNGITGAFPALGVIRPGVMFVEG